MRTRVIINPNAGSVDEIAGIRAILREHPGLEGPDVAVTSGSGDATALAADAVRQGFDRILACGGDGTLNEVVNGVGAGQPGIAVGILPMGTGNDFARSVGFPEGTGEALDLIATAVPRQLDLVRVTGGTERYCVNVAAGGFSGQVDEELTPEMKATWGPLAYLRSALAVLPELQGYSTYVTLDGRDAGCVDALNVVVANGRTAAGGIQVAPEARLDDGLLDVVIVKMAALKRLAGIVPRILLGKHLDHDLVRFERARVVTVRSRPGMWFNLDGELVGKEPLSFEALPKALTFLTHPTTVPGLGMG